MQIKFLFRFQVILGCSNPTGVYLLVVKMAAPKQNLNFRENISYTIKDFSINFRNLYMAYNKIGNVLKISYSF